jgi:Bifunctional DNA primase/polymerase, N-terminal
MARRLIATATDAAGADAALLRSALSLAGRGWHVFPCVPGAKRPALRGNWHDHATTDPARLRSWWGRAAYNIGIACGPSGLVVIDLDVPNGTGQLAPAERGGAVTGAGALAALCDQHGRPYPLPTYAAGTPSGGCHLYYAASGAPVRNSAGRLGPRIDVRAGGGYVIGVGSRIGGRRYIAWDERAPVPLPLWIAALLKDKPPAAARAPAPAPRGAQGTAYAMAALRDETRLVAAARPGTRNDTLNRAAFNLGQLTAAGLLPSLAIVSALAGAAERAGLPADEARRTIRSGLAAGARRPRGRQERGAR